VRTALPAGLDHRLDKPQELFDRDAEWADIASFAVDPAAGATLALVYGRRRQGKTLMLELLGRRPSTRCCASAKTATRWSLSSSTSSRASWRRTRRSRR
jgi:hypothetical protein